MRYYRYIYDGWKENATPEEMITLRGEIRRCCFGVIQDESRAGNEKRRMPVLPKYKRYHYLLWAEQL